MDMILPVHEQFLKRLVQLATTKNVPHGVLVRGVHEKRALDVFRTLSQALVCSAFPPDGTCEECRTAIARHRSDQRWVEVPEGKREIPVVAVHEMASWTTLVTEGQKVVFVPHAGVLSLPAQHALLKLVEDPLTDLRVYFALSSGTELLPTLMSRCTRVTAVPLSHDALATMLEHDGIDAHVADRAARLSHGDLDRARRFARTPNTLNTVEQILMLPLHLQRLSVARRIAIARELAEKVEDVDDLLASWAAQVRRAVQNGDHRGTNELVLLRRIAEAREGSRRYLSNAMVLTYVLLSDAECVHVS